MLTGAGLKCELDLLGLTPVWFAARCGAVRRSAIRWCDGESPIPERAILELKKIQVHTADVLKTLADGLEPLPVGDALTVTLHTYRIDRDLWRASLSKEYPALWHRLLTARLADRLRADGFEVTVDYVGERK